MLCYEKEELTNSVGFSLRCQESVGNSCGFKAYKIFSLYLGYINMDVKDSEGFLQKKKFSPLRFGLKLCSRKH
jgi:hypothetical protein